MTRPVPPLLSLLLSASLLQAEALFIESFAYADGELEAVSGASWIVAVDNGNPELSIQDEALHWDYTVPSSDPVNNGWYGTPVIESKIDAGPIFAHFDLTVTEAPEIEAGMFAGFWNGGSGIRARVWIGVGTDGSGAEVPGTFRLGMTESSGSRSGVVWDDQNFPEGTTVRVVAKYDFNVATLYLNAADESDVAVTSDDGGGYGLNGYAFRHKDDGDLGRFSVDNLAISLAFEDVDVAGPEAPAKLTVRAVPGDRLFLTWKDGSPAETGFLVERAIDGGSFTELATLEANENYYIDEAVSLASDYCYRVTALGSPDSPASDPACGTPVPDPTVEIIPDLAANAEAGEFQISIGSQRAVSYQLQETTDLDSWNILAGPLGGIEGTIETRVAPAVPAAFYRILGEYYAVPAEVGLTEPFQMPENGDGTVLNVADFGASSDDPSNDDSLAFIGAMAAASAGDIIEIPTGNYHFKNSVTVKSGITLRGVDRDTTVLLGSSASLDNVLRISSGANDITLRDFSIALDSGTMEDAILIGSTSGSEVQRVWIHNLKIEGFERRAVQIRQAKHIKVEDCRILNATALGAGGQGYGVALNDDRNNNNWVTGCLIGPVIRHGILIQYEAHHNLIENNTVFETTEDAIDLHGEDEYANEVRFNLCFWDDPSGWDGTPVGIGIGNTGSTHDDAGPFNWIHHNEVYGYNAGLEIILDSHHQFIDGNYFHNNVLGGIILNNGGGDGIMIRGNHLYDNGDFGVRAESSNALTIGNNIISGHGTGVSIAANSPGYLVTGNDLRGNTTSADLANDTGTFTNNLE